jgi:hypothetical protein
LLPANRRKIFFYQGSEKMKRSTSLLLISVGAAALLAGCATLAPERHNAEQLMGKNISEAYKIFGNPTMIDIAQFTKADDKLNGQKRYRFVRVGGAHNQSSVVGGGAAYTAGPGGIGAAIIPGEVKTTRVVDSCEVMFLTTKENIIDYYEIKGNCGFMDAGFGNTGALHRMGIN